MKKILWQGTWYNGIDAAAAADAEAMLPHEEMVGDDEDPARVAKELESFWWKTASSLDRMPLGLQERAWRSACREQLVARIERARRSTHWRAETGPKPKKRARR